ncbi:MAG: hypothetical protein HYT77_00660 [Deltaproteobacteria bacterium]|nr:hypothetical protein [Deltaproteobacteria bacterium]
MIQLVLSSTPVDEVPGKLVLATFFEDVRPLKGVVGLLDWRLNGHLSRLIMAERISGGFSESLIMPSRGRVAADEILLFGLGSYKTASEDELEKGFDCIVDKVARLGAPTFVISFGEMARDFMSWRALLRSFMGGLSQRIRKEDIQMFCAEDSRWIQEARRRNMDFGADVELTYA